MSREQERRFALESENMCMRYEWKMHGLGRGVG